MGGPVALSAEGGAPASAGTSENHNNIRLKLYHGGQLEEVEPGVWKYLDGNSFALSLPAGWRYGELLHHLGEKFGPVGVNYLPPGEDLQPDNLITVMDDDDLAELKSEYQEALKDPTLGRGLRLKVFLASAEAEDYTADDFFTEMCPLEAESVSSFYEEIDSAMEYPQDYSSCGSGHLHSAAECAAAVAAAAAGGGGGASTSGSGLALPQAHQPQRVSQTQQQGADWGNWGRMFKQDWLAPSPTVAAGVRPDRQTVAVRTSAAAAAEDGAAAASRSSSSSSVLHLPRHISAFGDGSTPLEESQKNDGGRSGGAMSVFGQPEVSAAAAAAAAAAPCPEDDCFSRHDAAALAAAMEAAVSAALICSDSVPEPQLTGVGVGGGGGSNSSWAVPTARSLVPVALPDTVVLPDTLDDDGDCGRGAGGAGQQEQGAEVALARNGSGASGPQRGPFVTCSSIEEHLLRGDSRASSPHTPPTTVPSTVAAAPLRATACNGGNSGGANAGGRCITQEFVRTPQFGVVACDAPLPLMPAGVAAGNGDAALLSLQAPSPMHLPLPGAGLLGAAMMGGEASGSGGGATSASSRSSPRLPDVVGGGQGSNLLLQLSPIGGGGGGGGYRLDVAAAAASAGNSSSGGHATAAPAALHGDDAGRQLLAKLLKMDTQVLVANLHRPLNGSSGGGGGGLGGLPSSSLLLGGGARQQQQLLQLPASSQLLDCSESSALGGGGGAAGNGGGAAAAGGNGNGGGRRRSGSGRSSSSTSPRQPSSSRHMHHFARRDVAVVRAIGEGAFGEVCQASVPMFGTVAVKWLKKERVAKYAASFRREFEVLLDLNHPNVLRMYGYVTDTPAPDSPLAGIVTEWVRGGSLSAHLRGRAEVGLGPLPLRARCRLALQAANGMAYLHDQSIVHFDLKPDNLLVDCGLPAGGPGAGLEEPGVGVKVADFGLAKHKWREHVSTCADLRGTLPYMAPELVSSPDALTEKVDVWSLGVCLWEMATCAVPFEELAAQRIISGLLSGSLHLAIPDWVEPEWRGLIEACMDYCPTARPTFVEVAGHLQRMLDELEGVRTGGGGGGGAAASAHQQQQQAQEQQQQQQQHCGGHDVGGVLAY